MAGVKYNTDPQSARAAGGVVLPGPVFDIPRMMSYIRAGLMDGLPPLDHPSDELLIATVIELGMPRWSADQMRYNPMLRYCFYRVWSDVGDAAKGNKDAQDRIDVIRATFAEQRKIELVTDDPNMSIGMWER